MLATTVPSADGKPLPLAPTRRVRRRRPTRSRPHRSSPRPRRLRASSRATRPMGWRHAQLGLAAKGVRDIDRAPTAPSPGRGREAGADDRRAGDRRLQLPGPSTGRATKVQNAVFAYVKATEGTSYRNPYFARSTAAPTSRHDPRRLPLRQPDRQERHEPGQLLRRRTAAAGPTTARPCRACSTSSTTRTAATPATACPRRRWSPGSPTSSRTTRS